MFQTSAGVISSSRRQPPRMGCWMVPGKQAEKSALCKQNTFKINTKHFALYLKYSNLATLFFLLVQRGNIANPCFQRCLSRPPAHHRGMSIFPDHMTSAFLAYKKHFIPQRIPQVTWTSYIKNSKLFWIKVSFAFKSPLKNKCFQCVHLQSCLHWFDLHMGILFFETCSVSFDKLLNACSSPGLCHMVLENGYAGKPATEQIPTMWSILNYQHFNNC